MHHHSKTNDSTTSAIFISVLFLTRQIFLAVLSLSETNNSGLGVIIRDDGGGVSIRLDGITETIKTEENTGVDGMSIKGGVNFDVALAFKAVAS